MLYVLAIFDLDLDACREGGRVELDSAALMLKFNAICASYLRLRLVELKLDEPILTLLPVFDSSRT